MVDTLLPLPAMALFSRRYFPKDFKIAAEKLMKAATDYLLQITEKSQTKYISIAGYPNDAIEDLFLDKIYQNLSLTGNESLLESFQELWKFQRFIKFVELDRKDLETLKIAQTVGRNVFSCSIEMRNKLCKFHFSSEISL